MIVCVLNLHEKVLAGNQPEQEAWNDIFQVGFTVYPISFILALVYPQYTLY